MMNKYFSRLAKVGTMLGLSGCSGTMKEAASGIVDPTERGLMYIAVAMVISALIRGCLNK